MAKTAGVLWACLTRAVDSCLTDRPRRDRWAGNQQWPVCRLVTLSSTPNPQTASNERVKCVLPKSKCQWGRDSSVGRTSDEKAKCNTAVRSILRCDKIPPPPPPFFFLSARINFQCRFSCGSISATGTLFLQQCFCNSVSATVPVSNHLHRHLCRRQKSQNKAEKQPCQCKHW